MIYREHVEDYVRMLGEHIKLGADMQLGGLYGRAVAVLDGEARAPTPRLPRCTCRTWG